MECLSGRFIQIIAVVTGSLSALSDGMQYGWSSPATEVLESPSSPVHIDEEDIGWLENLYMLGGVVGLLLTMYLLDKFGRKACVLMASLESLIAWILLGTAKSKEVLFLARFLAGIGADVNFMATPTYIAEISDKEIRGRLGSMIYIMMLVGIVLIYSVGPFVSIATSSAIGGSILIIQLLTFSFMPKSPYFLLVKNDTEAARKTLQILRGSMDVEDELEELAEVVRKENQERGHPLDLFRVKSNRKACLIITVLNVGQHFSGISAMLMNIHMILDGSDVIIPTSSTAIVFSVLMLISCMVSATLMDKIGRRKLLYISSFLTGVSLLLLASYFTAKDFGRDVSSYNWIPVFSVMLYAICFKCGLGIVPIVLTAELYPTNIKALGCAFGDAVYVVAGVTSLVSFHALQENYGLETPFFLFGFCCMFVGIFSILFVPETKGKSLEEIQHILKDYDTSNGVEKAHLLKSSESLDYGT